MKLLGRGGEPFWRKSLLPSPNPTPSSPKTFDFIESLMTIVSGLKIMPIGEKEEHPYADALLLRISLKN